MSVLFGDPALRLLARRKLRANVRVQRRRLRTVKGALFTVLGVLLLGLWLASLFIPSLGRGRAIGDPEDLRAWVRVGALLLSLLSISSAFSHRGLYLPSEEIQRLFSAPVSRSDLVRYRLVATMTRGVFGALIVGLVVMRRMPSAGFAFAGVVVAVCTLPVLNQLVAILSGGIEAAWARRIGGLRSLLVGAVVLGGALLGVALGTDLAGGTREILGERGLDGFDVSSLVQVPLVRAVTAPFAPWAWMVTASDWGTFLPFFAGSLAFLLLLFELTARLPVDYRELSLETSASVAARVRRVRRGGGVASGKASTRLAGVRVPWLLGRGPMGAIAWRKASAILRKAKGTLFVALLVIAFLTVIGVGDEDAAALIAILGTFYLTSGLRFDFRDDLDRMEVIKAWPVGPARVFAATLLPEVALVTLLVMLALCVHGLTAGSFSAFTIAFLLFQPLFVYAWVAVDNSVFLFAPVRFVPGQEGALQNAGRGVLLMFLRALVLLVVLAVAGGPAFLLAWLAHRLGMAEEPARLLAFTFAWVLLVGCNLFLTAVGGFLFSRFDVARDRG